MISVIIPYYQKEKGILARALKSVVQQKSWLNNIVVVIVDDGSPVSPVIDIGDINNWPFKIRVISQANSGPGAARNTGLDSLSEDTRFVAFLDSDDEWLPDHLTRAIATLSNGYEFYFSDFYQLNQNCSAFDRAKRININEHPLITGQETGLHIYQGDMLDQIITGNIIGTPTVVYLYQRFKDVRFDPKFKSAGEDYLFWMLLTSRKAKMAFSSQPEVFCGQGINIYTGAKWGEDSYLQRTHHEINYRKKIASLYILSNAQSNFVASCIAELRVVFILNIVNQLKNNNISYRALIKYIIDDPFTFFISPFLILKIVLRKLKLRTKKRVKGNIT